MKLDSRYYEELGSFINYSVTVKKVQNFDLEKWRRLSILDRRIKRYEESKRLRRIEEERQFNAILSDLWSKIPPTPLRGIVDSKVKRLFKDAKTKGLTRGREKERSIAACLFLVLSVEKLNSRANEIKISFDNIERIAKIFRNQIKSSTILGEVSSPARGFSEPDSSSYLVEIEGDYGHDW